MAWESILAKLGIDTVKGMFRAIKGTVSKERYRTYLSTAVAELLQLDPDINQAEANIKAAEALGQPPSAELLNAHSILKKVKSHSRSRRGKGAKKKASKAKKKTTKQGKKKVRYTVKKKTTRSGTKKKGR